MKVFNVEIKYLFNIESRTKTKSESIREESNLTRIDGLSEIIVKNALNTIELLVKSSYLREVRVTAINDQSSRSHATIFKIT
jgi:hypothetical protein